MAKILINSLLWYMNDILSCLTAETIIKIVSDFYSPEEIVEAKTVLHNNYEGAGRLKLRQGDQKSLHNIKDIHMVLLEMQNNKKSAPVLVTASSRFPSLDLKNIDACQLIQDINNLRQEFLTFKREKEMQTNAVVDLKSTVQELSYLLKKKECQTPELIKVDSHPEPIHSYSEILRKPMPQTLNTTYKNNNSSAGSFTKVEKRRRSTRIGRMKQSDLKVVEKPVNIFVSRFYPDVLESEIKQFAQTRFKSATTIIVEKLKTKFDSYLS